MNGFDKHKDATFYINEIKHNGRIIGYKYGITNGNGDERLREQNNLSLYELSEYKRYKVTGTVAESIENIVHSKYSKHIKKEFMKDGYTETFSTDSLVEVISLIESIVKFTGEREDHKKNINDYLIDEGERELYKRFINDYLPYSDNIDKAYRDFIGDINKRRNGCVVTEMIIDKFNAMRDKRIWISNKEKMSLVKNVLSELKERNIPVDYERFVDANGDLLNRQSAHSFLKLYVSFGIYKNGYTYVEGIKYVKASITGLF